MNNSPLSKFNVIYEKTRIWLVVLLAVIFPFTVANNYVLHLTCISMMYAMLTISLNVLSGFTGLMSVGHIAFFGIGAYTTAVLTTKFGISPFIGIIAGGILSAFFSLLLGLPTMKLKGTYFTVATLAFGVIVYQLIKNLKSITNGTAGILGIPGIEIFGVSFKSYDKYYFICLIGLALSVIIATNLLKSRSGRAILAIRESDIAAEAMGINVVNYKIVAFMVSAFIAGMAGALYTHEMRYISPEPFVQAESATLLAMMVIGGIGSIPGAIVGAFVVSLLPEALRFIGDFRLALYGAAVVIVIIFAPKGLGGLIERVDNFLCGKHKIIAQQQALLDKDSEKEVE